MSEKSLENRVEELFLRIFKWVLLVVMALSLAAAIAFAIMALSNWLKTENSASSEVIPPSGQIKFDDYLKSLDNGKTEPNPDEGGAPKPQAPKTSSFLKQGEAIIACSKESLATTHPELVNEQDWNVQLQREMKWLDKRGASPEWGENWVNERRDFICAGAKSKALQELIKSGKVPQLQERFLHDELGEFHADAWGKRLEAEHERVSEERALAEAEALAAGAKLTLYATVAGIAFGLFMVIALYLIFAKIETNLRVAQRA